jgi:hypothetical protein
MIGIIIGYIIAIIVIAYVSNIAGYGQGLYQYYSLMRMKTPEARKMLKEINETMEQKDAKKI